jgi:hypothetical protein
MEETQDSIGFHVFGRDSPNGYSHQSGFSLSIGEGRPEKGLSEQVYKGEGK